MKLTWTFYPRHEPKVSLLVHYIPQLDKKGGWGFLHVETNQAFVTWDCFKVFNSGDVKAKKDAFGRLTRLTDSEFLQNTLGIFDPATTNDGVYLNKKGK